MNKSTFQQMIQDILDVNRRRLATTSTPKYRVEIIQEMQNELVAMKEAYEAVHGKMDVAVFNEAIRIA